MLTAHANTTAKDFIAQLRTYVIAMGLSSRVVDCVDNLMGVDEAEEVSGDLLDDAKLDGRTDMKAEILAAVHAWLNDQDTLLLKEELIEVIEGLEV